jgi:hypothetical protein
MWDKFKKKTTSDVFYTFSVYFVNIVSETVILIKYFYHLTKRGDFGISKDYAKSS